MLLSSRRRRRAAIVIALEGRVSARGGDQLPESELGGKFESEFGSFVGRGRGIHELVRPLSRVVAPAPSNATVAAAGTPGDHSG